MAEIIKECDNCKYVMTDTESFPCNRCTRNAVDKWEPIPRQTNAMKIRSMTDEELAEFLYGIDHYMDDSECIVCFSETRLHDAKEDILQWLQSEAE